MAEGAAAAGRLWAGRELRRRWRSLVLLGVLAGLAGGVAVASIAGARRTDTAWERLRTETNAGDAIVFASQSGIFEPDWSPFAALPYVEEAGAFGIAYATSPELPEVGIFVSTFGAWLEDLDRHRIIEGRAPDPDDPTELVLALPPDGSEMAAEDLPEIGDTVTMGFLTLEQQVAGRYEEPEGPTLDMTVVGYADSPFGIAAIPGGGFYAQPSFTTAHPGLSVFSNLVVRLEDPSRDVARLEAEVARRFPGDSVPVYDLAAASRRVTNGTDLERNGLLLLGAAVAIAGLVVVGQALSRSVRAAASDLPTLSALGFSRSDAARAVALPHLAAVVVAVGASSALAVGLSARFPIGLGRRVEPDAGVHLDLRVVGGGGVIVVGLLLGVVAVSSWRAAAPTASPRAERRSRLVGALAQAGGSVPLVTGASLALEPGRGRRSLPTRPAVAASVIGVLGVVGALTLAAGLEDGATHGERFGLVWDLEAYFLADEPPEAFLEAPRTLPDVPGVASVSVIGRLPLPLGDAVVPFYASSDEADPISFATVQGRAPARPGEIVLGPDTARALGVEVGDEIVAGDGVELQVVGLGLLPTTAHSSFDQGVWASPGDVARAIPASRRANLFEQTGVEDPGGDAAAIRLLFEFGGSMTVTLDDGVNLDDARQRIGDILGPDVVVANASTPADQLALRNVRHLPSLFAAFSIVLALGGLGHVTSSVVRRRRGDLAVLRAIGCTPRQLSGTLAWQATTLAVVGTLVGLPVGLLVGRLAWGAVADAIPMVRVVPTATWALILAAPAAIVVANVVGAWPGRLAARIRPGDALRVE